MTQDKKAPFALAPTRGGVLVDPVKILGDSVADLTANLAPYVLAALGQMAVLVPLSIGLVFGIYLVIGVVVGVGVIGTVVAAEAVGGDAAEGIVIFGNLATIGATFFSLFAMVFFIAAATAPISASLVRNVAAHQRGEKPLTFMSAFDRATEDIVPSAMIVVLVSVAVLAGALFCYLPALPIAWATTFAGTMVWLHRRSPMEALRLSVAHALRYPAWHLVYFLLYFVCAMVGAYVPVLGPAFLLAFQVRAYRELFGDGEEPVLEAVKPG